MIDEKINQTLSELERNLKSVESAEKQVSKTVGSFNELTHVSQEYVGRLGNLTTEIKRLVDSIGKDYSANVKAFEDDRNNIINASNEAIDKLSNATDEFKESLSKIQKKLNYSLMINIVSLLVAITAVAFLFLKLL